MIPIKVSDRVVLKKGHPWEGYSGEVIDIDSNRVPYRTAVVELDIGLRCYAEMEDMRRSC